MTAPAPLTPQALDGLEETLGRLLPVTTHDTPDYAEVTFGDAQAQAMTMEPDTFLALNQIPALIAAARAGEEMREALGRSVSYRRSGGHGTWAVDLNGYCVEVYADEDDAIELCALLRTALSKGATPMSRAEPTNTGGDYDAARIAEVMDDGDGFWRACSGCQECVDGYVSEKDYPFNKVFRCQPGGGCSECGGLGVIWDNIDYDQMAREMFADEPAQPQPSQQAGTETLDPIWSNAVTAMLDRFDRAKGKGGYPTANEREAMRRCLAALKPVEG